MKNAIRSITVLALLAAPGMAFAGFPSTEVFLPAVGRVAGLNGAQFFTTIWVTNLTGAPESFTLQFLKGGQANPSPETFPDTLQPGETKTYENVVESVFRQTNALGAARIVSSGEIFVAERIFNQAPGTDPGETEGLFFAGVPKEFSISLGQSASIQGINQGGSENFRYNFALVETGNGSPTVNVQVFDGSGALLGEKAFTLQPFEQIQPNVDDVVPGFSSINARITATVTAGSGSVLIAGAQVANDSQDSSGFEMSFRGDLLGGQDGSGTAGVISLNGLSGVLNLVPGNGISVTPSGTSIEVAFTGGGSSGITSVVHDTTLAGDGTGASPLGVALPNRLESSAASTLLAVVNNSTDVTGGGGFFGANGGVGIFANSNTSVGIRGQSGSSVGVLGATALGVAGVLGETDTDSNDTSGVLGDDGASTVANLPSLPSAGVRGQSTSHVGVLGVSQDGVGVRGVSTSGKNAIIGQIQISGNDFAGVLGLDGLLSLSGITGVLSAGVRGESRSQFGILGASDFGSGVVGISNVSGPLSASLDSPQGVGSGVYGRDKGGFIDEALLLNVRSSGVRGDSASNFGVLGYTLTGSGVVGQVAQEARGELGTIHSSHDWAVFATGDAHVTGLLSVEGLKAFVEPHPTDPGKEIRFVSLEGPESGTYFRGSGHVVGGFARIQVPESFRDVTDENDITVQLTPVGGLAVLACVSKSLDTIVVQGSADIEFDYMINGVRKAYKDLHAIRKNETFVPDGPDDRRFAFYAPEIQRRLVATGIYNADGTVNLETAKRMGWDRNWSDAGATTEDR